MAAFLQTKGPVISHRILTTNWTFLKQIVLKQFVNAGNDLMNAGLGRLIFLQGTGHRGCHVFIKTPPQEAQDVLFANRDLISYEYYKTRYNMPVSKSLKLGLRHQLVSQKLVPENLLT